MAGVKNKGTPSEDEYLLSVASEHNSAPSQHRDFKEDLQSKKKRDIFTNYFTPSTPEYTTIHQVHTSHLDLTSTCSASTHMMRQCHIQIVVISETRTK